MKAQILLLLLYALLLVEGRDEFKERKEFHDWLCRKRPSVPGCSRPFTMSSYENELNIHHKRSGPLLEKTAARALAARSSVKRDTPWYDADEDEDYEYYLWKKYRREKLRRRLQQESFENSPSIHHYYHHNDGNSLYYNRPSYGYRYPSYGYGSSYPSYGSGYGYGYPSYGSGYGYPSYGGYGGGYGGGLFNMGITRGLGISTPIGGFGIGSSFGIGIG